MLIIIWNITYFNKLYFIYLSTILNIKENTANKMRVTANKKGDMASKKGDTALKIEGIYICSL